MSLGSILSARLGVGATPEPGQNVGLIFGLHRQLEAGHPPQSLLEDLIVLFGVVQDRLVDQAGAEIASKCRGAVADRAVGGVQPLASRRVTG